jgi:7-alpha-hydroxysteroid dehydrogenase
MTTASIFDKFRLDGKTAIVTGAGRGIGRGCAIAFAQAGADVVLCSRTESQLDELAAEIRALGHKAVVVAGDVSTRDAMARVVDAAMAELGRIDIVVNNVGGTMPAAFLDTSEADFRAAFEFNVVTAFNLSQLAVPHMLAGGGGSILNISSAMGHVRDRGFIAYGTTKAALEHFTRLLAIDLAPKIRVNAIAPGATITSALEFVLTIDEIKTQMENNTPLKRLGTVEEVAATALLLCSAAGGYISGKIIEVDGGSEESVLSLGFPDL